jgi:hypothetical protein
MRIDCANRIPAHRTNAVVAGVGRRYRPALPIGTALKSLNPFVFFRSQE